MLSVLPKLKLRLFRLARVAPMVSFTLPEPPIVSDLTVCETPEIDEAERRGRGIGPHEQVRVWR